MDKRNGGGKWDNEKYKQQREVDMLAQDVGNWWRKKFVVIRKARVKTWQGAFILAFIAGLVAAMIWMVSVEIQTSSVASGETASLILRTSGNAVQKDDVFTADIILNTNGSNVVVATAVVSYDPQIFSLQSWYTADSVFAEGNSCVANGKSCEIVNNEAAAGKITITMMKPSPGVNTSSGKVAALTFKALRAVDPASENITLSFTAKGSYDDSDVIFDNGNGTDILASVAGIKVAVNEMAVVAPPVLPSADEPPVVPPPATPAAVPEIPVVPPAAVPAVPAAPAAVPAASVVPVADNPPICETFKYSSAWSMCQGGTQTRTVVKSLPEGCSGGEPELTQECTEVKIVVSGVRAIVKKGSVKLAIKAIKKSVAYIYVNGVKKGTVKIKKGRISKKIELNKGVNVIRIDVIKGDMSGTITKTVVRVK